MFEPSGRLTPVRPISFIDALGLGDIEALFDGNGNHLGGLYPPLDAGNLGTYTASRPAAHVLGDPERQPVGLFWMMFPAVSEAGLGAVVAALDRGEAVVLFADCREVIEAACGVALPLRGGARA